MRGVEQIPWIYDPCCWIAERLGLAKWRRWLVGGAAGRTLEVGCGTGRNLTVAGPATLLVGLDPSGAALARARRRAPHVPLVRASAHELPFSAGAFDTVVSGLAFCSVPDPDRGLREVRRILAPGGTLRMIEHVRSRVPWKARMQDAIQPAWTWVTGGCHPNRDTESTVARAGFRIEAKGRMARGNMRRFAAVESEERAGAD
jgi:ubiquinone/menaquinone biosynthesis C-methylase UbiE